MKTRRVCWISLAAPVLLLAGQEVLAQPAANSADGRAVLGRWDLVMRTSWGSYPAWLEVKLSGYRTLVGSYVGEKGSARPVSKIDFKNGSYHFSIPPQWETRTGDQTFTFHVEGEMLKGETTDEQGRPISWTGRRAPALKRTAPPQWGSPIELFNAKDLTGWRPKSANRPSKWKVEDGLLRNTERSIDLVTEKKFTDFQLHAEFRYPPRSNSGIYLRGRYEVQIEDNYGLDPECHLIAGVYGFLTPRVNAARKAGEWQTFDITLVGRVVTIVFNGEPVIERQEIPGITGGGLDSDEAAPGPIMLQGDHGPIDFRKLTLIPALAP
jgi:hypothetical protein